MSFKVILLKTGQLLTYFNRKLLHITNAVSFLLSMMVFAVLVYDFGFVNSDIVNSYIDSFVSFALLIFAYTYFIKQLLTIKEKVSYLSRFLELLITFLTIVIFIFKQISFPETAGYYYLNLFRSVILSKIFIYILLLYIFIIELSKNLLTFYNLRSNPYKIFIYSYVVFILAGAGMLMLPKSTFNGISFVDALFTSTSAVCVTGLTSVETALTYTTMGKIIIMILIQIGGVGVMTFTSFFFLFSDNKFSFQHQVFLRSVVNDDYVGHVIKTLIKIIAFTIIFELLGAFLIYLSIYDSVFFPTFKEKAFYSVFHSVSAFCNAGFSTTFDNLHFYGTRFNYNIHLVIACLIIVGGLGFPIVFNYYKSLKYHVRNYFRHYKRKESFHHFPRLININTKIVVYTTIILLLFGTITYFITEYNYTLKGLSMYGKIVTSFFGSVTPRTAGFNTVNYANLSLPFVMICMLLMWIGASPNSTGGGIKTSTFALAFLNIISIGRGKDRVEIFKRRISDVSIRNAFAVLMLSVLVIGICVFLITMFENDKTLKTVMFECISAFGTVGLSLGITPYLADSSKIVLVAAMFIGRIGTLTFFVAFIRKIKSLNYNYPSENVVI